MLKAELEARVAVLEPQVAEWRERAVKAEADAHRLRRALTASLTASNAQNDAIAALLDIYPRRGSGS